MIKELKNIIPSGISVFTGIIEGSPSETRMVVEREREREGSANNSKKYKKAFCRTVRGLSVPGGNIVSAAERYNPIQQYREKTICKYLVKYFTNKKAKNEKRRNK